jgi:hypothetical protein
MNCLRFWIVSRRTGKPCISAHGDNPNREDRIVQPWYEKPITRKDVLLVGLPYMVLNSALLDAYIRGLMGW